MADYRSWDVHNVDLPSDMDHTTALESVAAGARNLKLVALRYRAKDNEVTERLIEPYEFKEGKLFGYDVGKEGIRAFIIQNILAAVVTNETFEPRFPVVISTPFYGQVDS
jgi:predicted DNA-binding transcriptional regulator YafY